MAHWDEHTDVVVVGSGLAGMSAAVEASGAGASVLVLEKRRATGGNSRISDGGLAAPGNPLQIEKGIADSPERFFEDLLRAGLGLNHRRLALRLAEEAGGAVAWTREILGVQYQERLDRFGGHSVARCLTTRNHTGADLVGAAGKALQQAGVEIRTGCLLTRFVQDSFGGVCGVEILSGGRFPDKGSGEVRRIGAGRGVVLATGGFGSDIAFRTLQNPLLDASIATTNHAGATAEGLVAALKIHAAPVHLSWIQLGPWGCPDEKGFGRGASFASYSVFPAGILIDPSSGRRIVDEWSDRRKRCEAMFGAGHPCIGIVDAEGAVLGADSLGPCLKRGTVASFSTLAELASAFDMPTGRLEATVGEYNRAIREGVEDRFAKPLADGADPIATPPFYAIRLWPKVHFTSGGVGIDAEARVIDLHGRPIPGLFAAGEVCGGVHGASRLACCALTECVVFGRIAGRRAAAFQEEARL